MSSEEFLDSIFPKKAASIRIGNKKAKKDIKQLLEFLFIEDCNNRFERLNEWKNKKLLNRRNNKDYYVDSTMILVSFLDILRDVMKRGSLFNEDMYEITAFMESYFKEDLSKVSKEIVK